MIYRDVWKYYMKGSKVLPDTVKIQEEYLKEVKREFVKMNQSVNTNDVKLAPTSLRDLHYLK